MAFKSGKANYTATAAARIKQLEAELAYERSTRPMLRVFAQRLGDAMLVNLASQPYANWPQFAKDSFAWTATEMPTAAYFYKTALPK